MSFQIGSFAVVTRGVSSPNLVILVFIKIVYMNLVAKGTVTEWGN